MPIFKRRIDAKIQKGLAGQKAKNFMRRKAERRVNSAKEKLDQDIDSDFVSKRIEGDPETIGYFGFEAGDLPVEELKRVMDNRIGMGSNSSVRTRKTASARQATYTFQVKFPSSKDIYSEFILNLPWISKTWVEAVERGLGNLEKRFVFRPGKGRSQFGVQLKGYVQNPITPLKDEGYIERIRRYFSENLSN